MQLQRKQKSSFQIILKAFDEVHFFTTNCTRDILLEGYWCQRWKICIVINARRLFSLRKFKKFDYFIKFSFPLTPKWSENSILPWNTCNCFLFSSMPIWLQQAWIQNSFSWVRVNAWSLLWAYGNIFFIVLLFINTLLSFIKWSIHLTSIQPGSYIGQAGILCSPLQLTAPAAAVSVNC